MNVVDEVMVFGKAIDWASIFGHPVWNALTSVGMVGATVLLVIVTWRLAKAAKWQVDYFERQEKRELKLNYHHDLELRFVGFELANLGVPPVTITRVDIAFGVPVKDKASHFITPQSVPYPAGERPSNFKPPHRLLTGEVMTAMYDVGDVRYRLFPGQRIQYECWDSFGNRYVSQWVQLSWGPIRQHSVHCSPGEGYREPSRRYKVVLVG